MAESDIDFQEAVEALREGKKARARELLTGLLKIRSEQCNLLGVAERHNGHSQGADLLSANRAQTRPGERHRQTRPDPARRAACRRQHPALSGKPSARLGTETFACPRNAQTKRMGSRQSQPGSPDRRIGRSGCLAHRRSDLWIYHPGRQPKYPPAYPELQAPLPPTH